MRHGPAVPAALVLLVLAASASPGRAQTPRPFRLSLGGGMTLLSGEDRTYFNNGYNVAGAVRIAVPAAGIGLRFEVSYSGIGSKDVSNPGDTLVLGDFSVLAGTVAATYELSRVPGAPTRPYVLFGGGMFRTEADATLYGQPANGSSTDFGITAGIGLNFRLGGLQAYAEARLHNIFGEGDSATLYPLTVGLVF